jgi:hypothetical protein
MRGYQEELDAVADLPGVSDRMARYGGRQRTLNLADDHCRRLDLTTLKTLFMVSNVSRPSSSRDHGDGHRSRASYRSFARQPANADPAAVVLASSVGDKPWRQIDSVGEIRHSVAY